MTPISSSGDRATYGIIGDNGRGNMGTISNRNSRSGGSCGFCTWEIVCRFWNTLAITILSIAVGFLFVQMQYVTYRVTQDEAQFHDLLDNLQKNQQGEIEQLNQKVEEEHSLTVIQISGTFTLLSVLITVFHIGSQLRNFHEPSVQRKIVAILWLSPIYAVTSFLSLLFPVVQGYLAIVKDFYESYVVYTFLSFLIAVLGRGNRSVVVDLLAQNAQHLKKPTRCFSRFYHPPPDSSDKAKANAVLLECQILAIQFVFVRPSTSIANFVLTTLTNNSAAKHSYFTSPVFFVDMIENVSVFLAFAGLLKLYHAARDHLAWCQPFAKFMTIKAIVFLTFWQSLVISIVVNLHRSNGERLIQDDGSATPQDQANAINNVLICMEMLFFSLGHWCVFPADEWDPSYRPKPYESPGLGLKDFVSDMSLIMESRKGASNLRRSRKSPKATSSDLSNDSPSLDQTAVSTIPPTSVLVEMTCSLDEDDSSIVVDCEHGDAVTLDSPTRQIT